MATINTIEEFTKETQKLAKEHPNVVPVRLDSGYGMHYAPSKKKPYYVLGEVRLPSITLKEDLREDLSKIRKIKILTIALIPKEMLSEKAIKLLEESKIDIEKIEQEDTEIRNMQNEIAIQRQHENRRQESDVK